MMSIKITGARQLSRKFNRLQKEMPKSTANGIRKTLKAGKRIAQGLAPQKSGELKAGIRYRVYKREGYGILSSTVSTAFPYNMWVNRSPGFRTIKGRFPFFLSRGRILYGGSARAPSRKPIQWTGTPGYFDKTIKILEQKYPKIMNRAVDRAINKSFR